MKHTVFFKLAVSSLILGGTMAGCTSTGYGTRAGVASGQAPAEKYAATAEKALSQDKNSEAMTAAEAAVAASPNNGDYRSLLGQAYLADGRFASAETSFEDAMTLGHVDARTVIGLAMVKIAIGKSDDARTLLGAHMDVVPAADYGLAIALAGDTNEGLRVLSAEVRQPDANAKVRQNLAYTLALAGRWRESKLMASQDLAPADAGKRVGEWAMLARPGAQTQQVARLMGVTPQADPGLPVRLALRDDSAAPIALAAAEAPIAMPSEPAELPSFVEASPMAETQTAMDDAYAASVAAPLLRADPAPIRSMVPLKSAFTSAPAPVPVASASQYVVQLGAFSNPEGVNQAWRKLSSHNQNIKGFSTLSNTAKVKGKIYHRLALSGFESRNAAVQACARLRSKGSSCFVRSIAGETASWVTRGTKQFAAL
ncbi:SPOR domain-containing protein [Rhizorhapis sp. SPR117]|uniref:SPOR domain-containing protein n=1 Tax=Rhizorhapis sp. SPR117 TaxID=2912611 RepID=UPI001EFFE524|nr:SPOR domain-containing protein [Rhizorhapis sp. SPR117]